MDFKKRVAESLASWEEKAPEGWEDGTAGRTVRPSRDPEAGTAAAPGIAPSVGSDAALGGAGLEPEFLVGLANATMPFGKYEGRLLIDLPEAYVLWFERQGFPEGLLGRRLQALLVIKANGLEVFLRPLVK